MSNTLVLKNGQGDSALVSYNEFVVIGNKVRAKKFSTTTSKHVSQYLGFNPWKEPKLMELCDEVRFNEVKVEFLSHM